MNADNRAYYAAHSAQALIAREWDYSARDSQLNSNHTVAITLNIPSEPSGILPSGRYSVAFEALQSIAGNANLWNSTAKVSGTVNYTPYSATIELKFPVPTREERYFPKGDRDRFLYNYSLHLVSQAVCRALVGYYLELQSQLCVASPSPRHPRDVKLEAIKGSLKERWRSLMSR